MFNCARELKQNGFPKRQTTSIQAKSRPRDETIYLGPLKSIPGYTPGCTHRKYEVVDVTILPYCNRRKSCCPCPCPCPNIPEKTRQCCGEESSDAFSVKAKPCRKKDKREKGTTEAQKTGKVSNVEKHRCGHLKSSRNALEAASRQKQMKGNSVHAEPSLSTTTQTTDMSRLEAGHATMQSRQRASRRNTMRSGLVGEDVSRRSGSSFSESAPKVILDGQNIGRYGQWDSRSKLPPLRSEYILDAIRFCEENGKKPAVILPRGIVEQKKVGKPNFQADPEDRVEILELHRKGKVFFVPNFTYDDNYIIAYGIRNKIPFVTNDKCRDVVAGQVPEKKMQEMAEYVRKCRAEFDVKDGKFALRSGAWPRCDYAYSHGRM